MFKTQLKQRATPQEEPLKPEHACLACGHDNRYHYEEGACASKKSNGKICRCQRYVKASYYKASTEPTRKRIKVPVK